MNPTTEFIAQIISVFLMVYGLSMLIRKDYYVKMIRELKESNRLLMIVSSMMALLLGLLIVLKHNLWSTPTEIIISVLGWLSLLKGISLAFMPESLLSLGKKFEQTGLLYLSGVILLAAGGYLGYVSFLA